MAVYAIYLAYAFLPKIRLGILIKAIFVFKSKTNSLPRQFDNYLKET